MAKKADPELDAMLGIDGEGKDPFAEEGGGEPISAIDSFDFSASEGIKDGEYHARVQEFTKDIAVSSGNPIYTVKVYMPEVNRSLSGILSLMPAALGPTGTALRALGNRPSPDGDGKMGQIDRTAQIGRLCRVVVKSEIYNGNLTPKIVGWRPPDEKTKKLFDEIDGK